MLQKRVGLRMAWMAGGMSEKSLSGRRGGPVMAKEGWAAWPLGGGGGGLEAGEVGGGAGAEVGSELWGVEAFAQFGGALWRLGVFGFVTDLVFDGAEDAGAGVGGGVERVVRWGWGFMRVYRNVDLEWG